jgi:GNAT superfamily N-acetyltransferase
MCRPAGPSLRAQDAGAGAIRADILAALPHWFGVPASVAADVESAENGPAVVATMDGRDCGILTLLIHTPYAAEIVVMGVRPELHRAGIGQALLERAEPEAERGIPYLQLKTLSRRSAVKGSAVTGAFPFGRGFRPLEEMPELWGPDQPALQMIKTVSASS